MVRAWNCASGITFASCHHWNIGDTHTQVTRPDTGYFLHYLLQVSLALQGSSGRVYKQLRQAISLPYPGVLRGTYDHTNGAVSSFCQTTFGDS